MYFVDISGIFASPFWVNLLLLVPIVLFFYWRKHPLNFHIKDLFLPALFGSTFGFIEAAFVIYLRAATGLLPGFDGTLADVKRQAREIPYNQQMLLEKLPQSLFTVEIIREAGTMIVLLSMAILIGKSHKERIALFLWTFAVWDIVYYVSLRFTIGWPESLTAPDVLFLIPEAWFSGVWFPLLVSLLSILAILVNLRKSYR